MTELLPCPFCNSGAEIDTRQAYRVLSTGALGSAIAIYCTSCSAQMTICREDHRGIDSDELAAELIEAWNKRAEAAEARAAIEAENLSVSSNHACGTFADSRSVISTERDDEPEDKQ